MKLFADFTRCFVCCSGRSSADYTRDLMQDTFDKRVADTAAWVY
jgi:hypothetical protein